MDKKEFLKEKYIKGKALELFPKCFDEVFNINNSYANNTLRYLKEHIIEYYENDYFTKNSDKMLEMKEAYNYIEKEYSNLGRLDLNSDILNELVESYDGLLSDISEYHFEGHNNRACGLKHNKSSRQILFEISLLYPVLINTLKKADKYLVSTKDSLFKEELVVWNITPLIGELGTTGIALESASSYYQEVWNAINKSYYYGGIYTNSDLGIAKKKWKLERNKACHIIYEFYQDIMKINKAIDYESFDVDEVSYSLEVSEIEELYNYAMENIATGPNYYCYLTPEERIEDRNANVLKKAITKM